MPIWSLLPKNYSVSIATLRARLRIRLVYAHLVFTPQELFCFNRNSASTPADPGRKQDGCCLDGNNQKSFNRNSASTPADPPKLPTYQKILGSWNFNCFNRNSASTPADPRSESELRRDGRVRRFNRNSASTPADPSIADVRSVLEQLRRIVFQSQLCEHACGSLRYTISSKTVCISSFQSQLCEHACGSTIRSRTLPPEMTT